MTNNYLTEKQITTLEKKTESYDIIAYVEKCAEKNGKMDDNLKQFIAIAYCYLALFSDKEKIAEPIRKSLDFKVTMAVGDVLVYTNIISVNEEDIHRAKEEAKHLPDA